MTDDIKKRLADTFSRQEDPPPFDTMWRSAERHYLRRQRRQRGMAAVAASFVAIAIIFYARSPEPVDEPLIEMAELLGSTLWQAPSDVLLPEHRIDLYEELPTLIDSPDAAKGALL